MSYLKETYLKNFSRTTDGMIFKSRFSESKKSQAKISIFLSHSHKDKEVVEGLISLIAYSIEVSIYVDWQDSTLPRVTNRETAQKIKERIAEFDCFLVLATKNAIESRWVPWEIGVADKTKSLDRIAIIPVADSSGLFYGNEYLQLYHHIELADSGVLGVFSPNANTGSVFKSWLPIRY